MTIYPPSPLLSSKRPPVVDVPGCERRGETTSIMSPPRGMRKFWRPHCDTAGSMKIIGEEKIVVSKCIVRKKLVVLLRRAIWRRRVGWVVMMSSSGIKRTVGASSVLLLR